MYTFFYFYLRIITTKTIEYMKAIQLYEKTEPAFFSHNSFLRSRKPARGKVNSHSFQQSLIGESRLII